MPQPLRLASSGYDHVPHAGTSKIVLDDSLVIEVESVPEHELFYRYDQHPEWSVLEMSMAKYASLVSRDDRTYVALPVFPSRAFRHGSIYVRRGLDAPESLRGRR